MYMLQGGKLDGAYLEYFEIGTAEALSKDYRLLTIGECRGDILKQPIPVNKTTKPTICNVFKRSPDRDIRESSGQEIS